MTGLGLGQNAIAVASHSVMIVILCLGGYRLIRSVDGGVAIRAITHHGLTATIAMAAAALVVERSYYIGARLLRGRGPDLWSAHPAPEVLSIIVSLGLYTATAPLILARCQDLRCALRTIARDALVAVCVFAVIAGALY